MPRNISEIYTEYKIMPNLAEHMFRVAAVASLVCDNFDGDLPKEEIVTACLLHDMGNIVKSNFEFAPEFLAPQGRDYWEQVKSEFIKKYSRNDHEATMKIIKEIGVRPEILERVDKIRFTLLCHHKENNDFSTKIISYADSRVDPFEIVSYEDRMNEAKIRYKDREPVLFTDEGETMINCGKEIEKQIFARCKIKPEDINNETVAPVIEQLRNFVIK